MSLPPFVPPPASFPTIIFAMWMCGVWTVLLLIAMYLKGVTP